MKQESYECFSNETNTIKLFCDSKTALGNLHDYLMKVKGQVVDRMVNSQKEEEAAAAEQIDKPEGE